VLHFLTSSACYPMLLFHAGADGGDAVAASGVDVVILDRECRSLFCPPFVATAAVLAAACSCCCCMLFLVRLLFIVQD